MGMVLSLRYQYFLRFTVFELGGIQLAIALCLYVVVFRAGFIVSRQMLLPTGMQLELSTHSGAGTHEVVFYGSHIKQVSLGYRRGVSTMTGLKIRVIAKNALPR